MGYQKGEFCPDIGGKCKREACRDWTVITDNGAMVRETCVKTLDSENLHRIAYHTQSTASEIEASRNESAKQNDSLMALTTHQMTSQLIATDGRPC